MRLWKVLPAADVGAPVGHAGGSEVDAGRHLAFERVPVAADVRGPEGGAVALRAQVRIARQDQRTRLQVAAEAVIDGRGVKERIDVEEFRARAYRKVASVGWQIWLGFVGPESVEALADKIVLNCVPVPLGRIGIRGVYIGARTVIRQSIRRRA